MVTQIDAKVIASVRFESTFRPPVSRAPPTVTVIKSAAKHAEEFAQSRIAPNFPVFPGGKFVIIAPSQRWGR